MKQPQAYSGWQIVGDGAVGMALAHRLHRIGEKVRLAGRTGRPDPSMLTFQHPPEPAVEWACPTRSDPGDQPVERLVLATKAFSVEEALATWRPGLADGARVYFLQNGRGFRRPGDLPANVHSLIVVNNGFAAFRSSTQSVVQTACEPLWIGDEAGGSTPASNAVLGDLDRLIAAGFLARWTPSIDECQWSKIAANAVINPLTAIFGCPNGELLDREEPRRLVEALCKENAAVLQSLGFGGRAVELLETTRHIIRATSSNLSSMLADLQRGHGRSELEFINHQLILAADEHGVSVPINRSVHDRAAAVFRESCGSGSDASTTGS